MWSCAPWGGSADWCCDARYGGSMRSMCADPQDYNVCSASTAVSAPFPNPCPTGYCKTPALYRECLELQKLGWNGACKKGWKSSKNAHEANPVLAALARRHGVK